MNSPQELAQEQELNLIGALLKDPSKLEDVKEIVTVNDLWLERAKWAYQAMLDLRENGMTIDTVTVGDELERHGKLEEWGGRLALGILRSNFRGDAPEAYAQKVLDYSAKRQMLQQAGYMATWSNNGRNSWEIREDMIRRLIDIKTPNVKLDQHTLTMSQSLSSTYDRMTNGREDFVPTGFIDLDRIFYGGFLAPDFSIIAGRPGQGKTSLLLSIALHAAQKRKRVLIESLEMSNEQVTLRLISMETGIPYGALIAGRLTREEWELVNEKIEEMESLPIHLNDMPAITTNGIRQVYRKTEAQHGIIDLIIIDYLQLQTAEGYHKTREQEVANISRGLKAMAKEFNVPVLAAAQLSRAVEMRSEKRPILSDLRESGTLEQDSDNVLFIHHPDDKPNTAEIIVAKHRNGELGSLDLVFQKQRTRFKNYMERTLE